MKKLSIKRATAFISSTFADMKDERNLIMYKVLPRVKKWAFDHGIIFDTIDLRWGINDEQAQDLHHTIKICLQKVKESDPLFVCLLGERYGWIPGKEDFNQNMFEKNIEEYYNLSATELEIVQAMDSAFFDSPKKSCLFLLREPLCFDNVGDEIKRIYVDLENADKLQRLKSRLARETNCITYGAELEKTCSLCNFKSNERELEDVLFDRIIEILIEKYQITNTKSIISEDVLVHQWYHLKYLATEPRLDSCQTQLHDCLAKMRPHEVSEKFVNADNQLYGQIAGFIEATEKSGNYRVIYRFMGIDDRILTANDLVCSIAYELSGDELYLDDPVGALVCTKKLLEQANEKVILIVSGLEKDVLADIHGLLFGLGFYYALLFANLEKDQLESVELLDYDEKSFEQLASYMLTDRAKTLTRGQFDKVLAIAQNDYSMLKIIINYLCTFASHETLDTMLDELFSMDRLEVTRCYLKNLCKVQDTHRVTGIMDDTIRLLCSVPYPITEDDITRAICFERMPFFSEKYINEVKKEVSFSLSFAREIISEYNSRFKIYDKKIKQAVLTGNESGVVEISELIERLYQGYMMALRVENFSFDASDAKNMCEIASDSLYMHYKNELFEFAFNDFKTFYRLAKILDKRDLVQLFKALAMDEMGYKTKSNALRRVDWTNKNDLLTSTEQALQRSIDRSFSLKRRQYANNIYFKLYSFALGLNRDDLISYERFENRLRLSLDGDSYGTELYKIQLPKKLDITSKNSTVYTIFDAEKNAFCTYFCCCYKGFLIVYDALGGKMKNAYAIPRDKGEVLSVFYQNKTISVVFEKGTTCGINVISKMVETCRFERESCDIRWFNNCYNNDHQTTVLSGNAIELLYGMRREYKIDFNDKLKLISVYTTNPTDRCVKGLMVFMRGENGHTFCSLVDCRLQKIVFSYDFGNNYILSFVQNEDTGEVYLETNGGFSFIVSGEDNQKLDVSFAESVFYHKSNGSEVIKNEEGVFVNGEFIEGEDCEVVASFATEKATGFICDNNILYYVSNDKC